MIYLTIGLKACRRRRAFSLVVPRGRDCYPGSQRPLPCSTFCRSRALPWSIQIYPSEREAALCQCINEPGYCRIILQPFSKNAKGFRRVRRVYRDSVIRLDAWRNRSVLGILASRLKRAFPECRGCVLDVSALLFLKDRLFVPEMAKSLFNVFPECRLSWAPLNF